MQIWAEVLGVPRVGILDDFFELGGHSLLATQLISRVRDALEVELPLKLIFRNPSAAQLGSAIEAVGMARGLTPTDATANPDDFEEFSI